MRHHNMDAQGHVLHKPLHDKPFLTMLLDSVYIPTLENKSCAMKQEIV